jgi:hypothetical protein
MSTDGLDPFDCDTLDSGGIRWLPDVDPESTTTERNDCE